MWKQFISDYLTFSKKDRMGMIAITAVIVIVLSAPLLFPVLQKRKPADTAKEAETINQLKAVFSDTSTQQYAKTTAFDETPPERKQLFYFDPNTASPAEWHQLGVPRHVAATIQKYISKGGRFKIAADLKKIYSMKAEDAERLIPYVRIRVEERSTPAYSSQPKYAESAPNTFNREIKKYVTIDVNVADTTALIALPGIGSKLAQRIVNFREKLGGFTSVDQVGETRFLPDSTFQKIKPYLKIEQPAIARININTALVKELSKHPYISYNVANAIVEFRNQNGQFQSIDQLEKIHIIDEALLVKIRPYVSID